jgi:hypothetical protein
VNERRRTPTDEDEGVFGLLGNKFFSFSGAIRYLALPGDGATLGTGTGKYLHGGKHPVDYVVVEV